MKTFLPIERTWKLHAAVKWTVNTQM